MCRHRLKHENMDKFLLILFFSTVTTLFIYGQLFIFTICQNNQGNKLKICAKLSMHTNYVVIFNFFLDVPVDFSLLSILKCPHYHILNLDER